jgi:hypothetical protein
MAFFLKRKRWPNVNVNRFLPVLGDAGVNLPFEGFELLVGKGSEDACATILSGLVGQDSVKVEIREGVKCWRG